MAVPTRITSFIAKGITAMFSGGGINNIVELPTGKLYCFYIDVSNNSRPYFATSLDGGMTWINPTSIKEASGTQISVWYDRWSGIDADLIHVVYTDSTANDVFYRNIDTSNSNTLSTEYTVFAGVSSVAGGALSISRMRGGNIIVCGCIDAGTEEVNRKSTDVGVNWSDIAVGYEDASSGDLCIVMPGWGADNQDAMMFYYDRSATEISVKYYDDSANSWSETSIATSISLPAVTSTLGHMNSAVDITNSQNLIVFWTAVDTANADLRCFKVTQSAQTETTTNVVLNSVDDQGFCGINIDANGAWNVVYAGLSAGTETYNTYVSLNYKRSTDSGANWSTETSLSNILNTILLVSVPMIKYKYSTVFYTYVGNYCACSCPLAIPRAAYQLGI